MMERRSIQECYFDPQFDSFALPDLGDLFDDDHLNFVRRLNDSTFVAEEEEEEKEEVSLKWRKGRAPFEKPRFMDS
ncbi:hypothetical protein ACOSQ2_031769 [Xanthoceras sorbifolium]